MVGGESGDGVIKVDFDQQRQSKDVIVVPSGHRRLNGYVYEDDSDDVPIADAQIEATGIAGASTVTSWHGEFRLHVPVGTVNIRITKDGYEPREETLTVTESVRKNFSLALTRPNRNIEGTYTLTVTAAEECRQASSLPEVLWIRRYTAALTQDGSRIHVTLTGASFAISADDRLGDNFDGWVEPTRVRFFLNPFYYWGELPPFVVEHIGDTNYLIIEGEASVDLPTTRQTGILAGSLRLFATSPWSYKTPVSLGECSSDRHRFTLSR